MNSQASIAALATLFLCTWSAPSHAQSSANPSRVGLLLRREGDVTIKRANPGIPDDRSLFEGDRIIVGGPRSRARIQCFGDITPTELTIRKMPPSGDGYSISCPVKPCK